MPMTDGTDRYSTRWNKSGIYCPDCSGDCLTDGTTLTCIECPFETTADSADGRRLIRQYYSGDTGDGGDA